MKKPIEPEEYKNTYYDNEKVLEGKCIQGCSLNEFIKMCEEKGFDFDNIELDIYSMKGFRVYDNVTVEKKREEWSEYFKKEDEYAKWAMANPENHKKESLKNQIEQLQNQLKKLEKTNEN